MQMLFEVTLFTAAIWLWFFLGKTVKRPIRLRLFWHPTFMVAMGLSVGNDRVSHTKGMNIEN
jgi:MATE family multidrug resistance protein